MTQLPIVIAWQINIAWKKNQVTNDPAQRSHFLFIAKLEIC